jgi:hypothetical protein
MLNHLNRRRFVAALPAAGVFLQDGTARGAATPQKPALLGGPRPAPNPSTPGRSSILPKRRPFSTSSAAAIGSVAMANT